MVIYNLYLFDRNGICIFYTEWNRNKQLSISRDEEFKLMYGMVFSIKSFVSRISPNGTKDRFISFKTSKYKLHFFETLSNLKFLMTTDVNVGNLCDLLEKIFTSVYVEYVVKNPVVELGKPITSDLFKTKLDECIQTHQCFARRLS